MLSHLTEVVAANSLHLKADLLALPLPRMVSAECGQKPLEWYQRRCSEEWDEHGVFSPDGEKLFLMSSHAYRDKPNSYKIFGLKTEFMLINRDGSDFRQVTHFNTPGFSESYKAGVTPAVGIWSKDGREIDALVPMSGASYPDYDVWKIVFRGNCGCGGKKNATD